MKRLLFLLLTVFTASTATAQPNYYGETEIYIDKELTLLSMPEFSPSGEIGWFGLAPKKEYEHYQKLPKKILKPGERGPYTPLPGVKGDMTNILEQAVKHAFTSEQLAQIPKEKSLSLDFYWQKTGEIYMIEIGLGNQPYFTSIPPAHYAKLMRYLKQHLKLMAPPYQEEIYDKAYFPLYFDSEEMRKFSGKHNQFANMHKEDYDRLQKIINEYEEKEQKKK